MKFLVIGHCSLDLFPGRENPESSAYGGIVYAVGTLSSLVSRNDSVVPLFGVHRDELPGVIDHLKDLPGVDVSALFPTDHPMPRIHYPDTGNRNVRPACAETIPPPIPFERIKRHLAATDAILLNMVSGRDVTLETLDELRMAVRQARTRIHLDMHNLTLEVQTNGERARRPLPEWRRWAFMIPTVQLNEAEIGGLTIENLSEKLAAGHILTLGVSGVLVTKGARGLTVYANDHKHVVRHEVPGIPTAEFQPRVGSGDVLGAAFLYHLASGADLVAAAEKANRVASAYVASGMEGVRQRQDGPEYRNGEAAP